MPAKLKFYGKELILDLHECNPEMFNRDDITEFMNLMCLTLRMERCDLHFWDYLGEEEEYKNAPDHLKGTSAIQFISTSNITIHTLDVLKRVYLNIFSCKNFNVKDAESIARQFFKGKVVGRKVVARK